MRVSLSLPKRLNDAPVLCLFSGMQGVNPLVSHPAYFSVCVCVFNEDVLKFFSDLFQNSFIEKVEYFEFVAATEAKPPNCNFSRLGLCHCSDL